MELVLYSNIELSRSQDGHYIPSSVQYIPPQNISPTIGFSTVFQSTCRYQKWAVPFGGSG